MLAQLLLDGTLMRSDVVQNILSFQFLLFSACGGGPENRETRHRRDAQIEQVRGLQQWQRGVVDLLGLERRQQVRFAEMFQDARDDLVALGRRFGLRLLSSQRLLRLRGGGGGASRLLVSGARRRLALRRLALPRRLERRRRLAFPFFPRAPIGGGAFPRFALPRSLAFPRASLLRLAVPRLARLASIQRARGGLGRWSNYKTLCGARN